MKHLHCTRISAYVYNTLAHIIWWHLKVIFVKPCEWNPLKLCTYNDRIIHMYDGVALFFYLFDSVGCFYLLFCNIEPITEMLNPMYISGSSTNVMMVVKVHHHKYYHGYHNHKPGIRTHNIWEFVSVEQVSSSVFSARCMSIFQFINILVGNGMKKKTKMLYKYRPEYPP